MGEQWCSDQRSIFELMHNTFNLRDATLAYV